VTQAASSRPRASDRATVERTVRDLILGVVEQRVRVGTSIVLEGAPGIGKTFLARTIVDAIEPGAIPAAGSRT
jgi:MoxR-like ATPase